MVFFLSFFFFSSEFHFGMTDPGRVEEYGERENLEARHQSLEREDTDRRRGGGGGGRPASSSGGGIGGGLGEENLGSGGSGRLRHGHGVDVGDDEITTLFVSGLPNDVLHREIHNLFRWFPGYQDSIIKQPKGKVLDLYFCCFLFLFVVCCFFLFSRFKMLFFFSSSFFLSHFSRIVANNSVNLSIFFLLCL